MSYNQLRNEYLECVFCNLFTTLYHVRQHLKSMKCKSCQALLIKTQSKKTYNILLLNHIKRINHLKSNIKQDVQLDEEDDNEEIKDDISVLTG